jgi:tetraacyldisaccharide 4'-kinase
MKSLVQNWYQATLLFRLLLPLLLPLSWLYCGVSSIRRKLYLLNIKKSYATVIPVVIVGNIVAGGSGKTPLLMALCEYIQAKGFKPGIVSRGYGGSETAVYQVTASDSAAQVGDEPLMMQQRLQIPVVIGADRVAAVNYLLENNQCDIVLSDDGLQHYRMQRDIEIVVVDASRLFGNGRCLPAGPLREKVSRLQEVDLVVYSTIACDSTESRAGLDSDQQQCSYALRFVEVVHLSSGNCVSVDDFAGRLVHTTAVHAVAGLGNPDRFFKQLRGQLHRQSQASDVIITEHAFADHHVYQQSDFSSYQHDCIIMTEKDAVKCRHLSLADAWFVRVQAEMSKTLITELEQKILPLMKQ